MATNESPNVTMTNSNKKGWLNIRIRLANKFRNRGKSLCALIGVPKSSVKRVLGKVNEKTPPNKIRSMLKKINPSKLKFLFEERNVKSVESHNNDKNKKGKMHSIKKKIKNKMKKNLNNIYQLIKKGVKHIPVNKLLETSMGKRVLKKIEKIEKTPQWKKLEAIWNNERKRMKAMLESQEKINKE